MARKYTNRVWVTTTTAGTGPVTLGSVKSSDYFTFAEGGVADGDTVAYVIQDGGNVEVGIGTYTSAGTTMSRDTVIASRIAGVAGTTKLTLSGSATVFIAEQATEAQAAYDFLENLAANSVLVRSNAAAGAASALALAASQLAGRGSSGNVAAIALGVGLLMSGTTLQVASYTVQVDFGSTPAESKTFDVALSGAVTTNKVIASPSLSMPAGVDQDEIEADPITVAGVVPSSNNIRLTVSTTNGSAITGKRNINVILA